MAPFILTIDTFYLSSLWLFLISNYNIFGELPLMHKPRQQYNIFLQKKKKCIKKRSKKDD